jgi:hypothetical protein
VQQALVFSTDVDLPAATVFEYYKLRFQIEFLFRDAKQHTGLGDCQTRKAIAQENAVNASMTTLNILKIQDRQESKTTKKKVISIESHKRRKANQQLMNLICDSLEIDRTEKKVRRKSDEYTFAKQKPPEGKAYTHSKIIACRLFELEWV